MAKSKGRKYLNTKKQKAFIRSKARSGKRR